MRRAAGWLGLLASGWLSVASAHPLAPALLQLRESSDGTVELLWRTSVLQALEVAPRLPDECRQLDQPVVTRDERGAQTARWRVTCDGGIAGKSVSVPQLQRAGINVIVHVQQPDGSVQQALLDATQPHYTVPAPAPAAPVFPSYLGLGMEHMAFGFDHVLFVVALALLVRRPRRLLLAVTAFTLGHSITLGVAALGILSAEPRLTELGIALSLLLLACELARDPRGSPGWLARWPATMALAFGLLHGLGFAGALADVGVPSGAIPLALLGFNLGIELAQILLLAGLALLALAWRHLPAALSTQHPALPLVPVYLIGTLAVFWTWERVAAFGF